MIVVLGIVAVVGTGWFVMNKIKQAGVDPELMQRSPALAMAKMAAAFNPDLEVLAVDEKNETVQVREKSSGKTMTLKLADLKNGKITVDDSAGGQVTIGGEAKLPPWVPAYPGASMRSNVSVSGTEQDAGSVQLTTADGLEQVRRFYEDELKKKGMKVESTQSGDTGWTLHASDEATERTVTLVAAREGDQTAVTVAFTRK
ncbi:MAG: hypothetical protein SFV54_22305 [Bryobacteraceae bacterium]|nr:hypothetical protein [Bryobacteraceae bacterium]